MWVTHLESRGFTVIDEVQTGDVINARRANQNIGFDLAGCHHAEIEGYIIEGHVPAQDIARLIREKPDNIAGLSVPGMPEGSPGMTGSGPFRVIAFDDEGQMVEVWNRY